MQSSKSEEMWYSVINKGFSYSRMKIFKKIRAAREELIKLIDAFEFLFPAAVTKVYSTAIFMYAPSKKN